MLEVTQMNISIDMAATRYGPIHIRGESRTLTCLFDRVVTIAKTRKGQMVDFHVWSFTPEINT
jgi:hypothetical protein